MSRNGVQKWRTTGKERLGTDRSLRNSPTKAIGSDEALAKNEY